jgi:hypothetical protein
VAPPARAARSGAASVLPPAPTVLSSRLRINREPAGLSPYVIFSVSTSCLCIDCEQECAWGEE